MGLIVNKRDCFGGSSNSAGRIKYDDTKNVKVAIDELKESLVYPSAKNELDVTLSSYTPTKNGHLLAIASPTETSAVLALTLSSGFERRSLMNTTASNGAVDIYVKAGDTVTIGATRCTVGRLEFYTND